MSQTAEDISDCSDWVDLRLARADGKRSCVKDIAIMRRALLAAAALLVNGSQVFAQYREGMRSDPVPGNVQGVLRTLRTDPDVGTGGTTVIPYPIAASPLGGGSATAQVTGPAFTPQAATTQSGSATASVAVGPVAAGGFGFTPLVPDPYAYVRPRSFDPTEEIRNSFGAPPGTLAGPPSGQLFQTYGGGVTTVPALPGQSHGVTSDITGLYAQPLVKVKMRVVEVVRTDNLAVSSVLDYVSQIMGDPTKVLNPEWTDQPNNLNRQGMNAGSRFANLGLLTGLIKGSSGAGALINLTGEHLNYVARLLAQEFNADVVTAPEVVTLNGQNVEFVAGGKIPFRLGQNVINGNTTSSQEFFYKHVGTYVSVTPRIVNWGTYAQGEGEAEIAASEIVDWTCVVNWMKSTPLFDDPRLATLPLSIDLQKEILIKLNKYRRSQLLQLGLPLAHTPQGECGQDRCKRWKPENCTIDLAVVVRLSEAGIASEVLTGTRPTGTTPGDPLSGVTAETNVRAVSNVIQVKSGHGVVMAGLIGNREFEDVQKVPVVGDIPVLGALFRSKITTRQKTEVLIFIEAQVLDPDPCVARAESSMNFRLGQPYVDRDFLDNPLEVGMRRAGFGTYLPPTTPLERAYWERLGRKVQKGATTIDDILK
jgi:hypothetical protein